MPQDPNDAKGIKDSLLDKSTKCVKPNNDELKFIPKYLE